MSASSNPVLSRGPYPAPFGRVRHFARRFRKGDEIAHILTLIFAAGVVLITSLLVYVLWVSSSAPRHLFGWKFFTTTVWDPVFNHFGALPFLYGTVVTSIVALIIAVPLGVGAAIFLAELAPRPISDALAFIIDLLAAVPSVIYGVLGIFVVVPFVRDALAPALESALGFLPFFKGPSYGIGVLTASLVLTIMIAPFIISVSREVLMAVPLDQREAALALGATRWESTIRVVVPFARAGIFGSIFLALARALGETMAVTMVIGNDPRMSTSLLAPGYTIAAVIANEYSEATSSLHLQALTELGLVLFLVTFILNGLARLLIVTTEHRRGVKAS